MTDRCKLDGAYGPRFPAADVPGLPLPDKPSIAILPFQNISGDPEQQHFGDGIAEDVTTALARSMLLFVVARNSAFAFRHRTAGVTEIGRSLWADRIDRKLIDIFSLQDEITARVAAAVLPAVARTERELAMRKPPENLGAAVTDRVVSVDRRGCGWWLGSIPNTLDSRAAQNMTRSPAETVWSVVLPVCATPS